MSINDLQTGGLMRVAFIVFLIAITVVPVAVSQTLPAFEARAESNQYRIGPGDVLDVRIFNRPLLSRESVRVDERGMIRLPLISDVRAACLTEAELGDSIVAAYREYLKEPSIEVFIKEYQSKPVVVVGAVKEPGRFQLQRQVDLIEIISLAGGLTDQAAGRIQVTHAPDAHSCLATQPDQTVELFDMQELLGSSSPGKVAVYSGDTINLLAADKVYVIGNVTSPAEIPLKEEITLTKALAIAGGTLPDSRLERVKIMRQAKYGPAGEIIVDVKAINRHETPDFVLQRNDIVEVPTSSGKKFFRGLLNSVIPSVTRLPVRVIR